MQFKTILDIEGIEFTVHGIYRPSEKATWKDGLIDQPYIPDGIDFLCIELGGEGLTLDQEDAVINGYGNADFHLWLRNEGRRIFEEEEEDNKINAIL